MLVLSRKRDETIQCNRTVHFTVIAISGNKARLGVTAPGMYQVFRKEIYTNIVQQLRKTGQLPEMRQRRGDGLLVLTRRRNEKIVVVHKDDWLSPFVILTVTEIRQDRVLLGFEASRSVTILREEVIQAETKAKHLP